MTDRPDQRPDVSLVVVSYRSAELSVRAMADAVAAAPGLAVEEVVCEGTPPEEGADAQAALLRAGRPDAVVVETRANRGFAAGNNAAIAASSGRYLLLLNPDAFAHDDAVARLVAHMDREPSCGVAAPALVFEDGSAQDNAHKRFPNLLTLFVDCCAPVAAVIRGTRFDPHHFARGALPAGGGPRQIAHATGAVLLVRAEAAAAAGPLDEGFFLYLEETEWQRRIAAAGWRIDAVPAAVFTHVGGGSTGSFPLATPYFLDSVERYYPRPRLALLVMGLGAFVSLAVLVPVAAVGRGGEKVAYYREAMGRLLRQVTARLRRRS